MIQYNWSLLRWLLRVGTGAVCLLVTYFYLRQSHSNKHNNTGENDSNNRTTSRKSTAQQQKNTYILPNTIGMDVELKCKQTQMHTRTHQLTKLLVALRVGIKNLRDRPSYFIVMTDIHRCKTK